jgi:hypothetical protein
MHRLVLVAVCAVVSALVAGCPVYSTTGGATGCEVSAECPDGYECVPGGQCLSTVAVQGNCGSPSQCDDGWTCGADNLCHAGDCGGGVGCPSGYACTLLGGAAQCLVSSTDAGNAGDAVNFDASMGDAAGDSTPPEATPLDGPTCIDGSCQ